MLDKEDRCQTEMLDSTSDDNNDAILEHATLYAHWSKIFKRPNKIQWHKLNSYVELKSGSTIELNLLCLRNTLWIRTPLEAVLSVIFSSPKIRLICGNYFI